jgi:hypothetical protein
MTLATADECNHIKSATLDEIRVMKESGELWATCPNAPEGPNLGEDFWTNAISADEANRLSYENMRRKGKELLCGICPEFELLLKQAIDLGNTNTTFTIPVDYPRSDSYKINLYIRSRGFGVTVVTHKEDPEEPNGIMLKLEEPYIYVSWC